MPVRQASPRAALARFHGYAAAVLAIAREPTLPRAA